MTQTSPMPVATVSNLQKFEGKLNLRHSIALSKSDCQHDSIKHFGAARNLVGLTECSRSVTAVQTVLCMCLYLKSVAAQRMVHTYVSMAGYAAYVNPTETSEDGTFWSWTPISEWDLSFLRQ